MLCARLDGKGTWSMRIHLDFPIGGHPLLGTFGARTLKDLELAQRVGMNLVFGGAGLLDCTTQEGRYCLEHGIRVMYPIAGHIHGRPRLVRGIGVDETEIPIADGNPVPGPAALLADEEVIGYEEATRDSLLGCRRGLDGTKATEHELSTILFWPEPLAHDIAQVKDSPNLWGYWALDDSPGYALSAMRGLYRTVRKVDDKHHPVCGGYSGATTLRNFGPGTCDIMGFYFYPFLKDRYERTMNSYDTQWILTDARKRVPGIPFIGIYQGFWEAEDSKRGVNQQGSLTPKEIREQIEDFVREGASGLVGFALLGDEAGELRGWNSDESVVRELRRINREILRTGGLRIAREPRSMARARIQPHGFYRNPREVPGIVPAWQIIGPFDAANGCLDVPFPPDSEVNLSASYPGKGIEAAWRRYQSYAGAVGLLEIFGSVEYVKQSMAYAVCKVTSPRRMKVQMRFGSDDDALVRFNGREVWRHEGSRGVHFDSDTVPVALERGETTILVKVYNREGQWGFFLRFTDVQGHPLKGLAFSPEAA